MTFQHLEKGALDAWQKDGVSAKELGEALIAVRNACAAHGDFTKWTRANKVDRNRANYCIRLIEGKVAEANKKKSNLNPDAQSYVVPLAVRLSFERIATARNITPDALLTEVMTAYVKQHGAGAEQGAAHAVPERTPELEEAIANAVTPDMQEANPDIAMSVQLELVPRSEYGTSSGYNRERITTADEAVVWIRDYLRDGPRPVPFRKEGHIQQFPTDGQAVRNIKTKAFRTALDELRVRTLPTGPRGGKFWHLPEQCPRERQ